MSVNPAAWIHRLAVLAVLAALSACGARTNPLPVVRFGTSASLDNMPFFVVAERALDRRNGIQVQTIVSQDLPPGRPLDAAPRGGSPRHPRPRARGE